MSLPSSGSVGYAAHRVLPRHLEACGLTAVLLVALTVVGSGSRPDAQAAAALPDVLLKAIARYPTLTSYADTGTVERALPGFIERGRFTTYLRTATSDLYFDYEPLETYYTDTKLSLDMRENRHVIWMAKGSMQTYDFALKSHEEVSAENGGQVRALTSRELPSAGASIAVLFLIYQKAGIAGIVQQLEEATLSGTERVGGRPCHKIIGVAAQVYPSGARTNVRPVTVWIDVESGLVRKIFEDTPKGYQPGAYSRTTLTFDPKANIPIDDKVFQFAVPAP